MADDKKDDHAEEGEGKQDFSVIPQKHIWKIVIGLIAIGIILKFFAPDIAANVGGQILEPFLQILWVYAFILILVFAVGEKKMGKGIWAAVIPMLIIALIIPMTFGFEKLDAWGPLILMVFAPYIGGLIRGAIKGGGTRLMGGSKEEAIETMRKEWLEDEEGARPEIREGNIAAVRDAARALIQETS